MLYTHVGDLPRHYDCWVDDAAVLAEPKGEVVPCRWFGLTSHPGRVWGCTVLLESGAVYRDIPPHRMAFRADAVAEWTPSLAQRWDCYSWAFATLVYSALDGLRCEAVCGPDKRAEAGRYLFTAAPVGDGFTEDPRQAKQFMFVALDNGRMTIQPTNRVVFRDGSWTTAKAGEWPTGLRATEEVVRCESERPADEINVELVPEEMTDGEFVDWVERRTGPLGLWWSTPNPAFEGRLPWAVLANGDRERLIEMVHHIEHGSYA